jgi:hypothetical protein
MSAEYKPTKNEMKKTAKDERIAIKHLFKAFRRKKHIIKYPNQNICARQIIGNMLKDILVILCTAEPQVGKTGTMFQIMYKIIRNPEFKDISFDSFYIITGLSNKAWIKQTHERFPENIRKNIFHRPHLKNLKDILNGRKNYFIFVDETHFAAKEKQTIAKIFNDIGFTDIDYLQENNIKLILFSATPNGVAVDMRTWGNHHAQVHLKPGKGYISNKDMLDRGRMFQYNLFDNNIYAESVYNQIQEAENEASFPLNHCVRINKSGKSENIIDIFKSKYGDNANYHDFSSEKNNIPDFIKILNEEEPPSKTTIMFIIDSYRCSKTLRKKYLGVWVERYSATMYDDVVIQGNRLVGYDTPSYSRIFTNINSVKRYYEILDNNCIEGLWASGTTNNKNGTLCSKKTAYHEPDNMYYDAEDIIPETPKNNYEKVGGTFDELFPSMKAVRDFLGQEHIWRNCMGMDRKPQPRGCWSEKSRAQCEGYAVTSKLTEISLQTKANRLTIEKANAIGLGSSISTTKKGSRFLILPVYKNMESLPNEERFQLRYLKILTNST